jgi:hypothetical protein
MHRLKLLLLLFFYPFISEASNLDSLFLETEVVFSGRITRISEGVIEDLGTTLFTVTIEIDSIYRKRIFMNAKETSINWQVSTNTCTKQPLRSCLQPYFNKKWIFFLNEINFNIGDLIYPDQIRPYSVELETELSQLKQKHLMVIDYFKKEKTCASDCELCFAIQHQKWKQVEAYFYDHANGMEYGYMQHRNIKWMLSDKAILASLPSYTTIRLQFLTDQGEVPAYANYQIGYYHSFANWIPWLLYKGFSIQAYKYFQFSDYNYLQLRSFKVNEDASSNYLAAICSEYVRELTDTGLLKLYGPNIPITKEYAFLASIFEEEMSFYIDHQTMADYLPWSKARIDTLLAHRQVYLLCLVSTHTNIEIGTYSLRALQKLNDKRSIPFLIYVAEELIHFDYSLASVKAIEQKETYTQTLTETLDFLTNCRTQPQSVPFGVYGDCFSMSLSIPNWKAQIKVIK